MGAQENPREPKGTQGNPREPQGIHGNPKQPKRTAKEPKSEILSGSVYPAVSLKVFSRAALDTPAAKKIHGEILEKNNFSDFFYTQVTAFSR